MKLKKYVKKKNVNLFLFLGITSVVMLLGGIYLYKTYALYEEKKEFNVLKGRIPDFIKQRIWNFKYTGAPEEFIVPYTGIYKIELWGAQGGNKAYSGGLGAYVKGEIELSKNIKLFVYVGGAGVENTDIGGYNGGGNLSKGQNVYGSPGGGATDIRLQNGSWDNFYSLKTRIMVAAGGGGANNRNITSNTDKIYFGAGTGGAGGGINGYSGQTINYQAVNGYSSWNEHGYGTGGMQNKGGSSIRLNSSNAILRNIIVGGFGKTTYLEQSGGGGGYFTGASAAHGGGGGGSSYISGHEGCLAVNESSTESNIVMKDHSEYKDYVFQNTVIIDGLGYSWKVERENKIVGMPNYDGTTQINGNMGNGYAKITLKT